MNEIFVSLFSSGIWAVIKAVLLLLLAFITAAVVKSLVGKLVHLLVFLLFVPGIFESLGMREVSSPILNLLNTLWGYLPNILAAVLVLWVGFFIARFVRELLVPVFGRMKVDTLQGKAGIQVSDAGKLSNTLAYIVYVLFRYLRIGTEREEIKGRATALERSDRLETNKICQNRIYPDCLRHHQNNRISLQRPFLPCVSI